MNPSSYTNQTTGKTVTEEWLTCSHELRDSEIKELLFALARRADLHIVRVMTGDDHRIELRN